MSGELAAAVAAVAVAVVAVALLFAVTAAVRALTTVRATFDDLRREAVPLLGELRSAVRKVDAELSRVDDLIGTAQTVGDRVDTASKLTHIAVVNPLVKTVALATGASRALRRLRGGGS